MDLRAHALVRLRASLLAAGRKALNIAPPPPCRAGALPGVERVAEEGKRRVRAVCTVQ